MQNIKKIFIISGVYIASLIGAGFATGQELMTFFVRYGTKSIIGLALALILLFLCNLSILNRTHISNINTFSDYLKTIISFPKLINFCITAFMFAGFCVMLAGSGATMNQLTGLKPILGIIIMATICFVVFCFDIKGVLVVNSFLAPIMIVGIFLLGLNVLLFRDMPAFLNFTNIKHINMLWSAVLYASYNIIAVSIILVSLGKMVASSRLAFISSLTGAIMLSTVAIIIWATLSIYYGKIPLGDVPFLTIISRNSQGFKWAYVVVLFASMLTSAISSGYSFIDSMEFILNRRIIAFLICLLGSIIAQSGFERLVSTLYSAFGYIGLGFLVAVLVDGLFQILNKSK